MAQEGPGADCGSDARPFLPLGRVARVPFPDLEQERWQDCLGSSAGYVTSAKATPSMGFVNLGSRQTSVPSAFLPRAFPGIQSL